MKVRGDFLGPPRSTDKVSKGAKIRNRYNQVPHLTGIMEGNCTHNPEDWKNKSIK